MAKFSNSIYFPDLVGSIGGLTIQQGRSGNIIRIKPRRSKNSTTKQTEQIKIFSNLSQQWQQLTRAEQLLWDAFALANPHITLWNDTRQLTGFNYFILTNYYLSQSAQPQITTPPIYTVPSLAASIEIVITSTAITLNLITPSLSVGDIIIVNLTSPLLGLNYAPRQYLRFMKFITYAGIDTFDITTEWETYFSLMTNADLFTPENQLWCACSCFEPVTGIPAPYLLTESTIGNSFADTLSIECLDSNEFLSYTGINLPPVIPCSTAISFSGWFKITNPAFEHLFFKAGEQAYLGNNNMSFQWNNVTGLFIYIQDDTGNFIFVGNNANNADDGNWHHIVFTKPNNTTAADMCIYLDGILLPNIFSVPGAPGNISTVTGFYLQTLGNIVGTFSGGMLSDECSLYTTELSLAQVTEIYNSGVPTNISLFASYASVVSWWRMGEGSIAPLIVDETGTFDLDMNNYTIGGIVADAP